MTPVPGGAFASIEVYDDIDKAQPIWTALIQTAFVSTYQNPSFLKAWVDNVAAHEGVRPMIVVARDEEGRAVALLPLGRRRQLGARIAEFLGGSHVNYNAPVIRRDALARFTRDESLRLLAEAARQTGVDLYVLRRQPAEWEGEANPFAALPSLPSTDPAYSGPLAPSFEDFERLNFSAKARSKQRRKMRRFEERGSTRLYHADNDADRRRLIDAFLDQKARQFAGRGVGDVFDKPGVRDFLASAAGIGGRPPALDLYGFDVEGEAIAVAGGLIHDGRYSGMLLSITSGEHAKYSPGEMLLNFVVAEQIRRGARTFDLGVGAAGYKTMYCPNVEILRDTLLGVTPIGRAVAGVLSARTAATTWVKSNPRAYALVTRLRGLRARQRSEPEAAADD
ncbi:GNAT family N-acetyltransferase [Hansschlegelia plantiphila]|uniref:BioF2-like acetyltransferase domain-containing protein n=1 Tax=Hansschlegelia plantiphila TaxID=374655 RepID=A0A9W6IZY2_9HYPH|nr:GNAT family N-acetyltransferase [Hansschlegelia plantiphila]GLK68266.1 hypothetical protein GCM10008179_19040 [Hansschlegelia plantiphila]